MAKKLVIALIFGCLSFGIIAANVNSSIINEAIAGGGSER